MGSSYEALCSMIRKSLQPTRLGFGETYDVENKRLREEMAFYRELTVSRDDEVTAIDGGKTAEKLHALWESRELMREAISAALEHLDVEEVSIDAGVLFARRVLTAALKPPA